jgi:hypothetical protein
LKLSAIQFARFWVFGTQTESRKKNPKNSLFAIIPMKEINQEDVTKRGAMPEWIN